VSVKKIANAFAREGFAHQFVGPEPTMGLSRQNIRHRIKGWLFDQYMTLWRDLTSTQRQAKKLILGPTLAAKTRLFSFNRMQSRAVTGPFNWK
jgi:hypothetical protein